MDYSGFFYEVFRGEGKMSGCYEDSSKIIVQGDYEANIRKHIRSMIDDRYCYYDIKEPSRTLLSFYIENLWKHWK